jgi:aspartyl-tRNA(Asn)/glutamyl-tRNA(Gln) amidotransferase subunit B
MGSSARADYETTVGLEVHVQLRTRTKLFCGCAPRFGDSPNLHTCPVCLGLPGALPVVNERAVRLSTIVAAALGCELAFRAVFARKNYFYPDLPKGYQISQYEQPMGTGGRLQYRSGDVTECTRIHRVHLEEDAGKSSHGGPGAGRRTLIDLNRCGTPLLEIVTEPELTGPQQASDFLAALRITLLHLDVTDANMEEGSLRCDANISLRPIGQVELNPKTELKNLNSFRHLRQALAFEERRQAMLLDDGVTPEAATRLWDVDRGGTVQMRSKEEEHDYRYFPDPDLVPLQIDGKAVESARRRVPELPFDRAQRLERDGRVSIEDARWLVEDPHRADYYDAVVATGADAGLASNWMRGEVAGWLRQNDVVLSAFPVRPEDLAGLLAAISDRTISNSAAKKVLEKMAATRASAREIIVAEALEQVGDPAVLEPIIVAVVSERQDEAQAYRAGRHQVLGVLIGEVMRESQGRADPALVRRLLQEKLQE